MARSAWNSLDAYDLVSDPELRRAAAKTLNSARLRIAARYIKMGVVKFPRTGCRQLLTQSLGFGWEKHDDAVDALVYLILGLVEDGIEEQKVTSCCCAFQSIHYKGPLTMRPPIFKSNQPDATPMQYMHRARQFRRAAIPMADHLNGEQFWPKYALLTHAIELALKAFVNHSTSSNIPIGKEPKQHDLLGWYRLAIEYGLDRDGGIEENIDYLNELHRIHYMRYPQGNSRMVPDLSIIADETVDHLLEQVTLVTNPS